METQSNASRVDATPPSRIEISIPEGMRDASNKDPHLAEEFRLMIDRPTASPTLAA
jgi:hypothetical protein